MARKRRLSCGLTCKGERATLTWLLSAGKILMEKSCKLQRCEGSNFQEEDFPKRKESLKFFYAIFHQTGPRPPTLCLKITEKSHSTLRAAFMLRSKNVTRQVNFNKTKIVRKCQNLKIKMRHFEWFSNDVHQCFFRKNRTIIHIIFTLLIKCSSSPINEEQIKDLFSLLPFLADPFFVNVKSESIKGSVWLTSIEQHSAELNFRNLRKQPCEETALE